MKNIFRNRSLRKQHNFNIEQIHNWIRKYEEEEEK